ncbi:hypothetical protein K1T71_008350 [Dendrolimus kikuchii]|uniref:Uncharacterized protein n=1 Tax=Dendrolimus kikuchii TaxID=765133 RepID=A0ACC1CWU5_9NEOP|nr:hypothetical protein K1T71_008350 [Dendrolimus kikuchii]
MSNVCQRYIKRHCDEKNGGSYMKLLNTLSTDLEEMLTELYEKSWAITQLDKKDESAIDISALQIIPRPHSAA